jgi:hypothetical protein
MATILSILNRLETTTSRLEKEAILKQNAGNMTLMRTFHMALDPKINFYIKQVPPPGPDINDGWCWNLYDAYASMQTWLSGRKVRGHEATAWLARLLATLTPEDQEVIKRVIGRNLKCGVSESTVEKIWPDLKLSYPCMLVSPMDSKTKLSFPMYSQVKSDGARFNAIVENGAVQYRSRNGKEIDLFGSMDREFLEMAGGMDLVFDGELLVVGPDGKPLDRKTGNGLLTKFQKGTGSKTVAASLRAVVWDLIPLEEFHKGKGTQTYKERYRALLAALQTPGVSKVVGVETTTVESLDQALDIYKRKVAEGEEGLVLKDPKGPWEDKRVKHQVKLKEVLDADLKVVGFTPGEGKYAGKIGSLMVESSDGKVKTSVGTGLSDADRSLPFSHYKGRIVEIRYNARITDKKTGETSLFLPVFECVRVDKDVASSDSDIK